MAARKFLVPIDLGKNELQNAVVQNLGTAPGTPVEGQIYYDTASHAPFFRNASTWVSMSSAALLSSNNTWSGTNAFNAAITGNNTINLSGTGSSGVGGLFGAVGFSNSGLTGAVTATRWVGGTASGAPASGTFSAGDFIVTTGGDVWVCTTGGTPGTWSRVGSYLLGSANTWTSSNAFNGAITGNNTINLTGTGASSVAGTFTGTALIASGLTGATSASRYVGATTSGAPATGTFVVGDFAVAQNGAIWVCTTGGSPGTWAQIGAAGSAYASVKANNGTAITQRTVLNFINGTFTTATAVDNASQSDIKFDVSAAAPTSAQTFGSANAAGSATTLSRSDHTHSFPAQSSFALSGFGAATADVALGGFKITGLGTPTAATDAATKGYVDGAIQGLDWKGSVRVVATSNGTLATAYANGQVVDGVTLATGDRILLAGQTTASENGIYTVAASGAPTRATDADANGEISVGTVVPVEAGTANANTFYYCTATGANPWVAGTSTSTWSFMFTITSTQAGAGLTATGNVIAVGAGTGITVNANDVAVDTSVVVRKFTTATHASATSIAITHSLGNQWVVARVYEIATSAQVEVDVVATDANTTTFIFATAPTANTYRFVIQG